MNNNENLQNRILSVLKNAKGQAIEWDLSLFSEPDKKPFASFSEGDIIIANEIKSLSSMGLTEYVLMELIDREKYNSVYITPTTIFISLTPKGKAYADFLEQYNEEKK